MNEFYRQTDRAGEDIVEGAVEGLFDLSFGAVVGNGDFHGEANVAGKAERGE